MSTGFGFASFFVRVAVYPPLRSMAFITSRQGHRKMAKQNSSIAQSIVDGEKLLPLRAVAKRWGVTERTVRTWVHLGYLEAARMPGKRGRLMFHLEDVVAFEKGCFN